MSGAQTEIYLHDRILQKALLWMIPRWLTPNFFTLLRLVLTPVVVYVNYRGWYEVGAPLFLAVAFTDAIDGSLARTRNQITNFGRLADPLADKLLVGSLLVVLLFRFLPLWLVYTVIAVEIVFVVFGVIKKLTGQVAQANLWGKIKMLLQVFAVFLILLGLTMQNPWLLEIAIWLFGAAIVFALVSLFYHGI